MNKKVVIGPVMITHESDSAIQLSIIGKDGQVSNCRLDVNDAAELAQTIINWVFKTILS